MAIKVGDKIDQYNSILWTATPEVDGVCSMAKKVESNDLFLNKKVVVFAIPGAYTPTCTAEHLPSYLKLHKEIRAKGVDAIYCISTNDPFVMLAFEDIHNTKAQGVTMLSDGNFEFTKKIGAQMDGSGMGLGTQRTVRYALVIDNGIVTVAEIENGAAYEKSSAEDILKKL
ncbi:peroxiredoxin [Tieghemostelium lacteum]|uniref:Peroxiredoxin n=1 Tax=Tieghemostelium lacteum TaxID=361077 RepID=A0A152A520_TIELA|nr:peroxiredoxin [Tieghemostelium lacteum]|eukprot:KYR01330.1 peroxiredoxin [Tieghemostelium lacteum]